MGDNINYITISDRDGNTIDVYENDISMYLHQYIQEREIKDMHTEPQSRWNAALLYINRYVFKGNRDRLMYEDNKDTYNDKMINQICDIYINLCYEYDKEVSINGFCKLTGIDTDSINSWGNGEYRVASCCPVIYKKLNSENEESLSNLLISGKRNPVGILGALNRRHGWNMGQPRNVDGVNRIAVSREEIAARTRTVDLLPDSADDLPD